MKRNLIYYVCPIASNNEWINNIDFLLKYIDGFNGKIIITIATGDEMRHPELVKQYIMSHPQISNREIKFIEVKNNVSLGEVPAFELMLKEIYSLDPSEITFYAHTKGVSPHHVCNNKVLNIIKVWRNLMYYFALNDFNKIDYILSDFDFCGIFWYKPTRAVRAWHFTGTFFWFRNKVIFERADWHRVSQNRFGVESYLGEKFGKNRAYNFLAWPYGNIYRPGPSRWQNIIAPYGLKVKDFLQ